MPGYDAIYVHAHSDKGTYANGVIQAPAYVSTNNVAKNYGGGTIKLVIKSNSGIEEITAGGGADVVYDLQGRRVANATRGLYIVNGKKALVK